MLHLKQICSQKSIPLPLLLYRLHGHTLSRKHMIMVSWSLSDGPFWFLHLLLVRNLTIMSRIGHRSRSQSQDCPGFQVLPLHQGPSMQMASLRTTLSLIAPRTPIPSQGFHQIGSGAISSAVIIHVFFMIRGASFLICVLTTKPLLDCHALNLGGWEGINPFPPLGYALVSQATYY